MWQKKSSRSLHKTPWLELVEDQVIDPDGNPGVYTYLSTKAGVSILAIDEMDRIYLVKQYRYPTDTWSWELPGGGSRDRDPLESAKEELHEELGLEATNWKLLKKIQAFPGTSDEWMSYFIAKDLKSKKLNHQTDDFPLEVKALAWDDILKWIEEEKINDSQTLAGLFLYNLKIKHQ